MLAPNELELLTAFVDGELDSRAISRVQRLLKLKPAARTLLKKLQDDSGEMQALPAMPIPADLTDSVVQKIQSLPRPLARRRPPALPAPRISLWVAVAVAAAMLLAIGVGSFLLHRVGPVNPSGPSPLVRKGPVTTPDETEKLPMPRRQEPSSEIVNQPNPNPQPPKDRTVQRPDHSVKSPMNEDEDPTPPERVVPVPDRPVKDVITAPGSDRPGKFERIELALPNVYKLHSLDQPNQQRLLREQLKLANAQRVELLTKDSARGFVHVQNALATQKITLTLDGSTATRLKKPQWRTDVALYLENITPEALTSLLANIGVRDRRLGEKKPFDQRFEGSVVVKDFSDWDRDELKELLGVNLIKDSTKVQPRSRSSNATAVAYGTMLTARYRGPELKKFLESRQTPVPGTLQVLLILRTVAP